MKRLNALLPLAVLLAGCSAPAAQTDATQAAAPAPAPAVRPQAKTVAAPAEPAKEESPYTVVDLAANLEQNSPPGMSPTDVKAMADGLKKVAVPPPPADFKVADKVRVILATTKGPITVELNGKEAPLHTKSFVYLTGKKFFDGTVFHRHADLTGDGQGFIIQGGDPLSKTAATSRFAGMGGPGYQIPREHNALKHDKLVIAAARSQDPNSAGSQFYITQGPVYFLDQDEGYTVFGKVVAGAAAALKLGQGDSIKTATVEPK